MKKLLSHSMFLQNHPMKKILSLFMSLVVLASLVCMNCIPCSAITRDYAIDWLKSIVGTRFDCDGNGLWCTDLATAWINFLWLRTNGDWNTSPFGTKPYTTRSGNQYDNYLSGNDNWTIIERTSSTVPQPGDMFVSETDSFGYGAGHVGVVLEAYGSSGAKVIEMSENKAPYMTDVTWGQSASYNAQHFIRFNYYESPVHTHDWQFKWFLEEHPHYDVLKCSTCGEERIDYDSAKHYYLCETCKGRMQYATTVGVGETPTQVIPYGNEFTISPNYFRNPGYKPIGWNLRRDGDNKWFVSGVGWVTEDEIAANGYTKAVYGCGIPMNYDASFISGNPAYSGTFTFTALWEKVGPSTIHYETNVGTGETPAQSVDYGSQFTISPNYFKNPGYKPTGWNLKRDGDNKWFVSGVGWVTEDEIAANGYTKAVYGCGIPMNYDMSFISGTNIFDGAFTFVALWEPVESTTFNYETNAGSGETPSQTVTYGNQFTISKNYFSNPGYTPVGWNLRRDTDNMWFVPDVGWTSEEEITEKGYTKSVYQCNTPITYDMSFILGTDVFDGSFTFVALWEEENTTEPTGTEPSEVEPTGTKPSEVEPSATEPTGTEPTETEPTATEPSEVEPTNTEPSEVEPTGTEPSEPTTSLLGDANEDSAVNMKDVLLARKYIASLTDNLNLINSDVNEDGTVNMKDVLMLRKFLAGLVNRLGA